MTRNQIEESMHDETHPVVMAENDAVLSVWTGMIIMVISIVAFGLLGGWWWLLLLPVATLTVCVGIVDQVQNE